MCSNNFSPVLTTRRGVLVFYRFFLAEASLFMTWTLTYLLEQGTLTVARLLIHSDLTITDTPPYPNYRTRHPPTHPTNLPHLPTTVSIYPPPFTPTYPPPSNPHQTTPQTKYCVCFFQNTSSIVFHFFFILSLSLAWLRFFRLDDFLSCPFIFSSSKSQ